MVIPHSKDYKSSKIFPCPQEERSISGIYKLKKKYNTEDLYDFYCAVADGTEDISCTLNAMLDKEEYILEVTPEGVKITSSTDEGKYRAVTSLRQLIDTDGEELECCEIKDKPDLKSRLWMIDISRGRIAKLEQLKHYIDYVSGLKYNEVSLYMESLCFKYPNFPKYTENLDVLTPEDIMELDRYAEERFITLVPMINGFGHLSTWLKMDEFKHLAIGDGVHPGATINPLLDESLEFIDRFWGSVLPYFKSKKVNIGFDEAGELGTYQTEAICKEKGKIAVATEWLLKVAKLAHDKYGMEELVIAQDMYIEDAQWLKQLPDYISVNIWNYSQTQIPLIEAQVMKVREAQIKKFYTTCATETYEQFTWRADLAIENIRTNAEMAYKYGADGIMVTEWIYGFVPTYPVWIYLPGAFAAQMAWKVGYRQETDAAYFKTEYLHEAERYCDKYIFKAPVSRLLYQFGNAYLLEPERIHGGSILGCAFKTPITQQQYPYFFDLAEIGDDFYFDNIIYYVSKLIAKIEVIDFNDRMKREIILNGKMLILCAEYCKIKTNLTVTKAKAQEISTLIDWIIKEHDILWHMTAYHKDFEVSVNHMNNRRKEIFQLI